jgi:hypothetical protein
VIKIFQILIVLMMIFDSSAQTCNDLITRFNLRKEFTSIKDTNAFCNGVEEALTYEKLALRFSGDPGHLTPCEYYSYERYGVSLEMTGDIIYDETIFERNHGFNEAMYFKIERTIPTLIDSIGKLPSEMIPFDINLMNEFLSLFSITQLSDSTALVILDDQKVNESTFESFEGVIIHDALTKIGYTSEEFNNGVIFKLTKNKSVYFNPNFKNYLYPNKICTTEKLQIPFQIKSD